MNEQINAKNNSLSAKLTKCEKDVWKMNKYDSL